MELSNNSLETAVVGLCMNGQIANALDAGLVEAMFSDRALAKLFTAMRQCFEEGEEINLPSVGMKLDDKALLPILVEVCEKAPITQNAVAFVEEIKKSIWVRDTYLRLANVAKQLKAWKEFNPVDSMMAEIEALKQIGQQESVVGKRLDETATSEWIHGIEDDRCKGGIVGISTGIDEIDCALGGGLKPGQLVTVGARTGVGKTALATNMALAAAKQGHRVQYFTIELLRNEIIDRFACCMGGINTYNMASRQFSDYDLAKIYDVAKELYKLPITIEWKTKRSWETVESLIRREKRLKNLKVAFIDYIQQFRTSRRFSCRREEIIYITGCAKELAQELEITIVIVAQVNRKVNDDPNSIPNITDLKESGSIEEDSNVVILLFNTADDRRLGLLVGKNRSGKKDKVTVSVDLSINKFYKD